MTLAHPGLSVESTAGNILMGLAASALKHTKRKEFLVEDNLDKAYTTGPTWIFVVDLDNDQLEVYSELKRTHPGHRFDKNRGKH
jgi:hypothetical protein